VLSIDFLIIAKLFDADAHAQTGEVGFLFSAQTTLVKAYALSHAFAIDKLLAAKVSKDLLRFSSFDDAG
jgi:hypothetical protein